MSAEETPPENVVQSITIFHNPHCSKSREALELVDAQGTDYKVVDYLKQPPNRATLDHIATYFQGPLVDLVRTGDAAFMDLDIDPVTLNSPTAIVDLLVSHPELMQRPLLVRGDIVVIARPPERVAELLVD